MVTNVSTSMLPCAISSRRTVLANSETNAVLLIQRTERLQVKNDEQSSERQDSRAKSPPDEPDAEGSAAVAIPIGYNNGGVAFVASTSAAGRGATLALISCLSDDISRRLGETPATKKVAFGIYKQYNFTCDTMTRKYDYHPARPPFKTIRWNCGRAEKESGMLSWLE